MKPYLLYLLCAASAYLLAMHIMNGRRRVVFGVMIGAVVWLGLSHLLYSLGVRGLPRHTISWPMLSVLLGNVLLLTPGAWAKKAVAVTSDDFDTIPQTKPVPLMDRADMSNPQ